MRTADIIIFVVYLSGIVIFGSSFYRKSRTGKGFTTGNGDIPAWVITLSIFATFVSSISYIALPGQAYSGNWNPFVFSLSIPVASFMAVKFFVPLYRSVNNPSAYAWLEFRFGRWARLYASSMYILTQLMRTGTILFLLALTLNIITGWNITAVILVTGIAVMVYSVSGGINAVVWTDAIQGIILIAGAVICAVYLTFSIPGGPLRLLSFAAENHKFSLGSFSADLSTNTFWVVLIYGIFVNVQNFGIDQNYIQRYLTASSEKDARKSALWGSLLYIPVSLLFVYIGTALFCFYAARPCLLPENAAADSVFPYFIVNSLPVGLTGIMVAAIFAAGMSTISTSINSTATVILHDWVRERTGNEKRSVRVLYLASVIFSLAGMGIAVAMTGVKSVLDAWWKLASVFSGGMLGLFLLGYFSKKAGNIQAAIGVIAGIAVIGWISLSGFFSSNQGNAAEVKPIHSYLSIVFGTLVIFITGFTLSVIISRKNRS
jgi:SSS family solute:Na+ symporter